MNLNLIKILALILVIVIITFMIINRKSDGKYKARNIQMPKETSVESTHTAVNEFPFEVIIVPGKDALGTVEKYKSGNFSSTIPVIMRDLERLSGEIEYYQLTPDEILQDALEINIDDFFKERENLLKEIYGEYDIMGEWVDDIEPRNYITSYLDFRTGEPLNEVHIGLIPTNNSYEIPAYVKYGGWNACPMPEEHVAIMKYWNEKYGAKIISITGDTIGCVVDNPPTTKEEAMALAREQFLYCDDIVTQGCESISILAGTLLNARYWEFWWD